MKLKEMIKVMQHFEDGGEVEYVERGYDDDWEITDAPLWDWYNFDYRIKEPKQKVTIEKWLCRNGQGNYAIIGSTNVNEYRSYEKIKLIESYEVEL